MARFLALEWDSRQARVALAQTRGKEVVIEQAFDVELKQREAADSPVGPAAVGPQLAAALAARRIGRIDTLVAVGRTNIELRRLTLPPVPAEELPELVRFQALRQFTTIGEDWPLDFVPVESRDEQARHVLAAAISPELVGQIRQTCDEAELAPRRLVLRPFAAASLLRRRGKPADGGYRLVVDLLTDEADLTVLADDGQVVFMRTVRLPAEHESEAQVQALVGELRRTLGAAQNQSGGQRARHLVLCGDGTEHARLKTAIEQQLSLEVELFDPFSGLKLGRELAGHRPDYPGRFAPLLGMLLDEAAGTRHDLDFLHPRRRPVAPDRRRRQMWLAAGAATLLLALGLTAWGQVRSLNRTIDQLQTDSAGLDEAVQRAEQRQAERDEIQAFTASDVPWLDELRVLSARFPDAEQALLTQLSVSAAAPAGGQMMLEGYARQSTTINVIGQALRDERHRVFPDGGHEDQRRQRYPWQFKTRVVVEPEEPDLEQAESEPGAVAGRDAL